VVLAITEKSMRVPYCDTNLISCLCSVRNRAVQWICEHITGLGCPSYSDLAWQSLTRAEFLRLCHSPTVLPSLQPQAIIHSFNEINSLETDVLLILPLCLAPGTFFDVGVFRIIRWTSNSANDTGLQMFIQDVQNT